MIAEEIATALNDLKASLIPGSPGAVKVGYVQEYVADLERDIRTANAVIADKDTTLRTANELLGQQRTAIERLTDQRTEATRALNTFKDQVRDEAQQHVANSSECIQGLNEVLVRLGLDPVKIAYEVTVSIMYEPRRASFEVEADNEDAAAEEVKRLLGEDKYQPSEGNWDDLEIRDIDVVEVSDDV